MATENRTHCGTPSASEWEVRGHLAASLTFWHRLKDGEDDELVALLQRWGAPVAGAVAGPIGYALAYPNGKPIFSFGGPNLRKSLAEAQEMSRLHLGSGEPIAVYAAAPGGDALKLLRTLGPKPWETSPEAHAQARLIEDFAAALAQMEGK